MRLKTRDSLEIPERARNLKIRLRPNITYIIGRCKAKSGGAFEVSFGVRRLVVAFITDSAANVDNLIRAVYAFDVYTP